MVLFSISFICSDAQVDSLQMLTDKRQYKNEIGVDLSNVFHSLGSFNGASIIYKKKINPGRLIDVNAIRSLRFLLKMNGQLAFYDESILDTLPDINFRPQDKLELEIGFGWEKQSHKKSLITYYGADVLVGYFVADDDFTNLFINGVSSDFILSTDNDILNIAFRIMPFFGIKKYLTSRMSISVETGLSFGAFYQRVRSKDIGIIAAKEESQKLSVFGVVAKFENL